MGKKPITYHFLITVHCPMLNKMGTYSNKFEWNGNRYGAFLDRFNHACQILGSDPNYTFVTFWSFEPDEL